MSRWVTAAALAALVAACEATDDSPPECEVRPDAAPMHQNAGFIDPTEITQAYAKVGAEWVLQGNANYGCLGDGTGDSPTTVEVILTGETRDYQTSEVVPNVDLAVVAEGDPLTGTPIATARSAMSGEYSLTVPIGTGRVALVMSDPEEYSRFLDTIELHYAFEPNAPSQTDNLDTISHLTANAMPAFVGERYCSGDGLLYGRVLDCDGNKVDGAIVAVSATPRTTEHLRGTDTYYFSAGSSSLPVRHSQQESTNHDGLYGVLARSPTPIAYVQAWGYIEGQIPGGDDLTLLSEVAVVVRANTVGHAMLEPLRE